MNIIFLGPPGAGKGTHAADFSKELGVPHISTGDIFREAVKNQTPVGLKAKEYMDRGELVPDDVVVEVVLDRLKRGDCQNGYILDGFPRSLPQAEMLSKAVTLTAVIYFQTSKEVIFMRLTGRRICKQCGKGYHVKNIPPKVEGICDDCGGELYQRKDDSVDTIEHRLKVYNEETKALIDYYKNEGILIQVNGDYEKQEGHEELKEVFKKLKSKASC